MGIILASGSPRRRELLEMLGLEFEIRPAKGGEHPPEERARRRPSSPSPEQRRRRSRNTLRKTTS